MTPAILFVIYLTLVTGMAIMRSHANPEDGYAFFIVCVLVLACFWSAGVAFA